MEKRRRILYSAKLVLAKICGSDCTEHKEEDIFFLTKSKMNISVGRADRKEGNFVVEVKEIDKWKHALGQVLAYKAALDLQGKIHMSPRLELLCESIDPQKFEMIHTICKYYGVDVQLEISSCKDWRLYLSKKELQALLEKKYKACFQGLDMPNLYARSGYLEPHDVPKDIEETLQKRLGEKWKTLPFLCRYPKDFDPCVKLQDVNIKDKFTILKEISDSKLSIEECIAKAKKEIGVRNLTSLYVEAGFPRKSTPVKFFEKYFSLKRMTRVELLDFAKKNGITIPSSPYMPKDKVFAHIAQHT